MAQRFELQPIITNTRGLEAWVADTSFSVGDQREFWPHWTEWVLPWTLVKDKPGVATLVIDYASVFGTHQAIAYLKASQTKAGALTRSVIATYIALAARLGVDPAWIAALVGAADVVRRQEWFRRIAGFVEANAGGLVLNLPPMWLNDP